MKYTEEYLDAVSIRITSELQGEFPDGEFSREKTRAKLKEFIREFSILD